MAKNKQNNPAQNVQAPRQEEEFGNELGSLEQQAQRNQQQAQRNQQQARRNQQNQQNQP